MAQKWTYMAIGCVILVLICFTLFQTDTIPVEPTLMPSKALSRSGVAQLRSSPRKVSPQVVATIHTTTEAKVHATDTAPLAQTTPHRRERCEKCRTQFDSAGGTGYPPVAFPGPKGDMISPSMFRDMADYVISWPFAHFGESVYQVAPDDLDHCLPPVPVVYWQPDGTKVAEITRRVNTFPKPFILVTGQSAYSVPSQYPGVLSSPRLLRWFGQYNDMLPVHPKFTPIPVGLNCWEHCTAVEQVLANRQRSEGAVPPRKKLFIVNFTTKTHPERSRIKDMFCKGRLSKETSCNDWVGLTCTICHVPAYGSPA